MKSFVATLLLLLLVACTQAFTVQPLAKNGLTTRAPTSLNMVFGNRKAKAAAKAEEDAKYWQGEWVCKDCGYIYNKVSSSE
jgi:rubrerythrin